MYADRVEPVRRGRRESWHLRSLWVTAVLLMVTAGVCAAGGDDRFPIIPEPRSLEPSPGSFRIDAGTSIVADGALRDVAEYLAGRLRSGAGHDVPVRLDAGGGGANRILLRLKTRGAPQSETGREGYRLRVRNERIDIAAPHPAGLFHGVQTLLQMLPPSVHASAAAEPPPGELRVPNVEIIDRPRFAWRGLMIDVSRHFFSKRQLLKTIDAMAMHKLNVLHLHLTDDPGWRLEIDRYPKLTSVGAIGDYSNPEGPARWYFSKDDMREIVAHAAKRHIRVVPEIDMPGHGAAAARAYPRFFDGDKTMNPGNEATYGFVSDVLTEVMALFPSEYIHFGGDEVRDHRWAELPEIQRLMRLHGYTDLHEVEGHFDRFVADFIVQQGRIPIGWDEVVNFGVNKKTVVQWWLHLRPEALQRAVQLGHRVILSPTNYLYFDYPAGVGEPGAPWEGNDNGPNSFELIHQWEPVPETFTPAQEALVLGLQANLWTEFIRSDEYYEYMLFPRLSALAEIAWSPKGKKDLDDFRQRLETQCRRYEAMGLNYRQFGEWPTDFRYLVH